MTNIIYITNVCIYTALIYCYVYKKNSDISILQYIPPILTQVDVKVRNSISLTEVCNGELC